MLEYIFDFEILTGTHNPFVFLLRSMCFPALSTENFRIHNNLPSTSTPGVQVVFSNHQEPALAGGMAAPWFGVGNGQQEPGTSCGAHKQGHCQRVTRPRLKDT